MVKLIDLSAVESLVGPEAVQAQSLVVYLFDVGRKTGLKIG